MKNEAEIRARLEEIEQDVRLGYPPANVITNAPLALIQVSLAANRRELRWVLDE